MYRLTRSRPTHRLLREQLPSFGGALLLAELFFKLHSFTLECLAFLVTWWVLDGLAALATAGSRESPDTLTREHEPSCRPDSGVI